ncbi:cell division control protein 45 homolog [Manduca sexta]|uniref:cell division control protein 45 homolog n=1 Tax=Manduca sexta TaxID=7130 RepID=UPI00188F87F7|nr:cell division control protein 45 homolog [Manduca sexta]
MFIEDLKNDFYNLLLGNRVLLLVHYDVDAVCTCKILQDLFRCDNISYTLVPVGGIADLKTAYEENNEEIKYVVLVNCGGTIDLVDILQPEEDVVFFVLDAHKPTDVCNVYSDGQVRLVYKDEEEDIPNFDDIFRDDEDENEEEVGEGREGLEALVERRRERKAWEEKRNTLMFNYTQFSYYGKPSACVALDVSWRLSRAGVAAAWCCGVALEAAAALHQRSPPRVLLDAAALHAMLAARPADPHGPSVILEKDMCLPLYRVWSLESALRHAPDVGPHLRLHTVAGASRLRQLLVDMGVPLQQARQAWRAMDAEVRGGAREALAAAGARLQLAGAAPRVAPLLTRPHAPPLAALDLVFCLLETLNRAEGFQHALAALETDSGDNESRRLGWTAARRSLEAVVRLVNNTLSARTLHRAGPFNYFIVQEGTPEAAIVCGPLWLGVAARWAAAAAGAVRGRGGAQPLVASAGRSDGAALLLGVPPRSQHEPRNLFGAAFEQAATKSGVSISLDYFDSSVVFLPTSQRAQFLDALTALLA